MNKINFDELKKDKIKFENTTFQLHKLSAIKAMDVMELIRVSLAKQLDKTESVEGIFKAILKMPSEDFKIIQEKLFESVTFVNDTDYKDPQPLNGVMRQSAFAKLDVFDLYELTLRCLVRNFFYSFQKLQKFMEILGLNNVHIKSDR